jgi:predicted ATPase/DNA-binding SARP family transcriptional activator
MTGASCVISPLSIRLFGPFEVRRNGIPLPRPRTRKGRWLLALLILRAGAEVERNWLAGTLWPDSSEPQAFTSLRNSLADLRQMLGPDAVRLHSPSRCTLCLDLAGAEVDLLAFDAAIGRGDPPSLEAAAGLYRGPLLEGCAEEWVLQERRVREQAYLMALETLAAHAMAHEEPAAAERHLRLAVAVDPLRESAQRALMQALAAGGNYAAALLAYRELRLLLHRELNAGPDPETAALFQQLRAEARTGAQARPPAPSPVPAASPTRSVSGPMIGEGTLTFLLTDVAGSTPLWEEHPQAMAAALARHDALAATIVAEHAGTLVKHRGEEDSLFAVFPGAADGVAAALALQRALGAERWPEAISLQVRMALHTGDAVVRDGDYVGATVNRCARLRAIAHGGQVLLSRATQELVRDQLPEGASLRDLGECRLKDLARPEQVCQLLHPDLPGDFPPLHTLDTHPNNLPAQPTPMVGREVELEAARRLLREEVRLVTLTGPGGVGKTRLGLQVAAELLDDFPDGVFLVELAPIIDPGLVASTIAQRLGIRETGGQPLLESLKEYLREKQLLLVLDNFEHVLAAAPRVAELLTGSPQLQVLVTSRAVLHLRGEQELPVPPLAVPDPKRLPPTPAVSQYAAVELFIQRALNVRPDFAVTDENAPAVAEICARLDGLPLAIELAAARIRLLSPEALLARLERRLPLLTGGARDLPERQQTLRAAIGWSYDLLQEGEQRLFRRLSVFVGGCTLEAAEAVCHAEGELAIDVLDGVASLVDKSLLQQDETGAGWGPRTVPAGTEGARAHAAKRWVAAPGAGEPRLAMLETIREYGLECLEASGEAVAVRRRHAHFFLGLAEAAEPPLAGADQGKWLARLEREHANLRAALEWLAESGEAEGGLLVRGYWSAGRGWLERHWGNDSTAQALLEESLAIFRRLSYQRGIAASPQGMGEVASAQGDAERARTLYEESLALLWESQEKPGIAGVLEGLAKVLAASAGDPRGGEWERAVRLLGAAAALRSAIGTPRAPAARAGYQRLVDTLRAGLGEEAFAQAWAAGRAMTLEQAVADAMDEAPVGTPDGSRHRDPPG